MSSKAKIIGVHPIEADEPVHLIEILVEGETDDFDIGAVTQKVAGQPKSNWQAPYDERLLEASDGKIRYAFFFHYLDLKLPLITRRFAAIAEADKPTGAFERHRVRSTVGISARGKSGPNENG